MGQHYRNKVFLGPNAAAMTASTYYSVLDEFKSPAGWRNSIGALFRIWQWYDGAGDRLFDFLLAAPIAHDGTANFAAFGALNPQFPISAFTPNKPDAGDVVETYTTLLTTVSGSPIVTRATGAFDPAVAKPGLGISAASGIALGSIIKRVLSETQIELDRNAIASVGSLTARTFKPPALCKLSRMFWTSSGAPAAPVTPWPTDGIQFGLHTAAGGAVDSTGIVIEAWPIIDENTDCNVPAAWELPGLGSY